MFRHTCCSTRLQTVHRVAPVSADTVFREMGHSPRDLVKPVHRHLGAVRHGPEMVEHRAEQHGAMLRDRLESLRRRDPERSGTASDTSASEVT